MSYVTLQRAKDALRSSYDGFDDSVVQEVLDSCSTFVDTYCNRPPGSFVTTTLDELYDGTGDSLLHTRAAPIQSLSRVATISQPCLSIQNNDSSMGCRATVSVTSTGVTTVKIKSAVTTTNSYLFATYPTVSTLSAAIHASGDNWTSFVQGGYGEWSSADIRATQGAFGCRVVTAYLYIHSWDIPAYRVREDIGEIFCPGGFWRGVDNYRIAGVYGYTDFPDDLAQALAELVAQCFYIREVNSNLQSESIGASSYSRFTLKAFEGLSDAARQTLNSYKRRIVPKFSSW